jgi:hypothetical protein
MDNQVKSYDPQKSLHHECFVEPVQKVLEEGALNQ